MATTKKATPTTSAPKAKVTTVKSYSNAPLFGKENYRWMLIGIVLVRVMVDPLRALAKEIVSPATEVVTA